MGIPMTAKQMKRARVHPGRHDLCYRCDSFEKNYDGTCELCGLTDRISSCIKEWCPYCRDAGLSDFYERRCSARIPAPGEKIRNPTVGPLLYGRDMVQCFNGTNTYAILCGSHVKIGKSKDVQRRLAQLQTGAPLPASILGSVYGDCEREIHKHLRARGVVRTNGEWFEYNDDTRVVLAAYGLVGE